MNRLSPLIVRRVGPLAAAVPLPEPDCFLKLAPAQWLEDLKLFVSVWMGGLVFFGTLLG